MAIIYDAKFCQTKIADIHVSLMKVHYPKLYNMAHLSLNVFTASKGSNNYILFAITAAGVVPCGGPKKSPRTSSIVQIIFFF